MLNTEGVSIRSTLILFSFFFAFNGEASNYEDFSGIWVGQCKVAGKVFTRKIEIAMDSSSAIIMNGQSFNLNKPTVFEVEDEYMGEKYKKYKEVTVYDFKWDSQRKSILTSANWLGWYSNKNGTWNGSGVGSIKFEDKNLIVTRKFSDSFGTQKEEVCTYHE